MAEKNEINTSNSEWVIMECLWDKAPLTVTQIAKAMEEETGWAKSTTKTLISRMEAKGCLRYEEGGKTREIVKIPDSQLPVYLSRHIKSPCMFGFCPAIYIHPDSLAGDESTLIRIGDEHRKAYGNALINMIGHRAKPSDLLLGATTMTSGKSGIKERIAMIARKPKMTIYTLFAVLLAMAVTAGCTFTGAKIGELEIVPLSEAEIEQYNKTFEPLITDEQGNLSINPLSNFLTSYYDRPEDINFAEFLRYFHSEEDVTEEAEFEALKTAGNWPFGADMPMERMPVPIHKFPAETLNEALKKYMSITLDDLSGIGLEEPIYLKEYDAYYNFTSDAAAGIFVCTRGEKQGDIIRLYGKTAMLTLKKQGDGFLFVSHQRVEDGADNKPAAESGDGSSLGSNESDNQHIYGEITQIDINYDKIDYIGSKTSPVQITDSKIISDITAMISQSEMFPDDKLDQMRPMTKGNNKLILTDKDGNKTEVMFAYDDLYKLGYVQIDGKLLDPGYDFFRYLDDYVEYRQHDASVNSKVSDLFSKYGWTADYLVNSVKVTFPPDLTHKAGEFPIKLYWAYNNELSKSVGLDYSGYLGENVNAEIYKLREPLPDFLNSRSDARGIIIKHNGEIIGAYIDAGRHSGFACSLDRKSLEDVTGKDWGNWIDGYIDYFDELETKLSSMSPEELIQQYFEAMDEQDERTQLACMTRSSLCRYLFVNMDNNLLYNSNSASVYSDGYSNVNSAKLIDMSEMKDMENPDGVIEYRVTVDYGFKKVITSESGVQQRFVLLMKETGKGGWRISGVGTGP